MLFLAIMAATLALSESEAVIALGSRTTMLHPEMKRHRAWWREILSSEVPKKLAGRASSSSSAAAKVYGSWFCCCREVLRVMWAVCPLLSTGTHHLVLLLTEI